MLNGKVNDWKGKKIWVKVYIKNIHKDILQQSCLIMTKVLIDVQGSYTKYFLICKTLKKVTLRFHYFSRIPAVKTMSVSLAFTGTVLQTRK